MTIKTDSPAISVKLIKSRSPNGVPGEFLEIDLTRYLTEGSSVTTHKALNNPNGGFAIRMVDRFIKSVGQSVYASIEPMDAIEIRMSRNGKPVLVMRGMVTDVSLDETMGSGGQPSRNMTIKGGDYGAILRMIQIHSVRGQDVSGILQAMGPQYFWERFGVPNIVMPAAAFIIYMVDKLINAHLGKIANPALLNMLVDTSGADNGDMVYMLGLQANPEGTLWSHIQKHGNIGPFYELFFEDAEESTTLVYRKPPFKKLSTDGNGEYIFPETSAKTFVVPPVEVTALSRSRSEQDVSNFYYVRAPNGDFFTETERLLLSATNDGALLSAKDYPNCKEDIYGFRMLEVSTNHGLLLMRGSKENEYVGNQENQVDYMLRQIQYLKDCNIDNVVFESGTIRCAGRPDYKPGMYCEITWSNDVKFICYVHSVTHAFEPFKGYTCTIQYTRGTEFLNKLNADHPYFNGKGVYE